MLPSLRFFFLRTLCPIAIFGWSGIVTEGFAKVSFEKEIRPLFQAHCTGCHQPAKVRGGYLMTDFASLLKGGESGETAVVPGKPELSYLIDQIRTDENGVAEMPKGKTSRSLHAFEFEKVEQWIREGALNDSPKGSETLFSKENPPRYETPPVIRSIDFSPDGQHFAITGFHEALIGESKSGKTVARLIGLSERIESVAFSPNGRFLAVAGGQPGRMGEIQVWEWALEKLVFSHVVTFDTLYGVSWSSDGTQIGFGASDTSVRVIDSKSAAQQVYMAGHDDWVRGTVFSADGKSIFSVSRDKTVKKTDLATERFVGNVTTHTPGILNGGQNSIVVRPEKTELLVGGADGKAKLFRQSTKAAPAGGGNPNQIREFPAQLGRIFSVCFNPAGNLCFAGSSLDGRGEVRCFEVDSGKQLWSREFPQNPIYAVSSSPDGSEIAVGGYDGVLRLLKISSGEISRKFTVAPVRGNDKGKTGLALNLPFAESPILAGDSLAKDSRIKSLRVSPSSITIGSSLDYAQVLVFADLGKGRLSDVTRMVQWSGHEEYGQFDNRGLFTPKANGKANIRVEFQDQTVEIPLSVAGLDAACNPDFIEVVNPIISKLGCNAGTCHGAKDGKNGFKLSLRGYDALYDIRGFTDDMASRRVNVAAPDRSLMLLKATATVPHEGRMLIGDDSRYHRIIRSWIRDGATVNPKSRRVREIKIYPENPVVERVGEAQQFRVTAIYEDGSRRDVTRESFVTSGNGEVAEHDDLSLLTTQRRGEAPVLARYEGRYAATTLTVMGDRQGFEWKQPEVNNDIDRLVSQKWKRMKIRPSDLVGDLDFLRRIHLDLTGLPPSDEVVDAFLEDNRSKLVKRDALIDRLVGSEPFVEHWSNKWSDLLQVNGKFIGRQGAVAFREWIEGEIRKNTPYDQFARKVLTASGSNKENPPASYYKILRTPEDTMENTTHLFLATRFNCNKCHDHPFERWTQDQYYEMAAHFAQFKLEKDPASGKQTIGKTAVERAKPLYEIVSDGKEGEIKHERTGMVSAPGFPYPADFEDNSSLSRRERMAAWMTSADNRYFAKSYVNRIWGYLFGVGIIEPIDDIRAGNPPSNPELLTFLEREFIDSGFDSQRLIRLICKSRTYQLSVLTNSWNEDDEINFSHALPRRLPAETLLDAVFMVTGSKTKFPGVPEGTRAASLPDVGISLPDGFLGTFGRPARETSCECERSGELQLGPVMALVSGPTINDAISDPNNAITRLAKEEMNDRVLINRLFLRILNRPARGVEIERCLSLFGGQIEGDHQKLVEQLGKEEEAIKDWLEAEEKARDDSISQAQDRLSEYQEETAEEVNLANRKRNARIKEATDALHAFDKTLPQRLTQWERDFAGGKSVWENLKLDKISSKIPGIKFEQQEDGSVFVGGRSAKGSYVAHTTTSMKRLTGVRIEAIQDERLPRKGPGRAPNDGNFVLTELEVLAEPSKNLQQWELVEEWGRGESSALADWKPGSQTKVSIEEQGVSLAKNGKTGTVQSGNFYHIGPFVGVGFDQKAGPEMDDGFELEKEYALGDQKLRWSAKPEWQEGKLYGSVFSAGNSSNYLMKVLDASEACDLSLSLGSDDGLKVYLNGRVILSNNVGRAAAPNQEKVNLPLKKGKNYLLLKIHNGGGASGFYYKSESESSLWASLSSEVRCQKGSFSLELDAKSVRGTSVRARWKPPKLNGFSSAKQSAVLKVKPSEEFAKYRVDFSSREELGGLQVLASNDLRIRSMRLYRNGLPVQLKLERALATFSQKGYPVVSAIDGKVAPSNNGWAISPQMAKTHFASFQIKDSPSILGDVKLTFTLKQEFQSGQHSLGRFRLAVTNAPRPVSFGLPENVRKIFAISKEKRTAGQRKELTSAFKSSEPERVALEKKLAEARKPLPVDPQMRKLEVALEEAKKPLSLPSEVVRLRRALGLSKEHIANKRIIAAQDLTWALINTPAFLFNR